MSHPRTFTTGMLVVSRLAIYNTQDSNGDSTVAQNCKQSVSRPLSEASKACELEESSAKTRVYLYMLFTA